MMKTLGSIENTKTDKNKRRHKMLAFITLSPFHLFTLVILSFVFVSAVSCSSIDCPLNNLVYTNWQMLNADGTTFTMTDTLTISTNRTDGSDSVLINKDVNTTSFSLPISYSQAEDMFFFEMKDSLGNAAVYDTVTVAKENMLHFESVDCNPSFFHKITGVSHTCNAVDSIVINYPDVNYDTSKEHLYIYFRYSD